MMLANFTETVIKDVNEEMAKGVKASSIQEKIERLRLGVLTEDEIWHLILSSYKAGVKQK